jgi:ABC-type multidrug transport system fused ATPase/permease subunit
MDDTLKRNVAFGEYDEDIVETKVIEALKDAELFEFVKKHPKRLDLIIGERGIRLSGGERQRLGIARALYRDPEILVMDEATSSLDNFTEQQIMNSIKKLRKKHTIIMIAHRLSTIRSCDRVYLIENGVIKDFGQLDKLLERYPYLNSYQDNEK